MKELPNQDREGGAAEIVRAQEGAHAPVQRIGKGRVGLQGKLVLSFAGVLAVALAASYWVFAYESRRCVADIMGDQARQLTYSLALASKPSLAERNEGELRSICNDLLKAPNVLFVA